MRPPFPGMGPWLEDHKLRLDYTNPTPSPRLKEAGATWAREIISSVKK